MSLNLIVNDLIRIAYAGGGMTLSARKIPVNDLIRIAHAASDKKARLKIIDAASVPVDDLIRIAHAGAGAVEFE